MSKKILDDQKAPIWIRMIGVYIFLLLVLSLMFSNVNLFHDLFLLVILLVGLFISAGLFFSRIRILDRSHHIRISLLPFGFRLINYSNLESVNFIEHINAWDFGGGGWRVSKNYSTILLWKSGPGLEFVFSNGKKILLQTNNYNYIMKTIHAKTPNVHCNLKDQF